MRMSALKFAVLAAHTGPGGELGLGLGRGEHGIGVGL